MEKQVKIMLVDSRHIVREETVVSSKEVAMQYAAKKGLHLIIKGEYSGQQPMARHDHTANSDKYGRAACDRGGYSITTGRVTTYYDADGDECSTSIK